MKAMLQMACLLQPHGERAIECLVIDARLRRRHRRRLAHREVLAVRDRLYVPVRTLRSAPLFPRTHLLAPGSFPNTSRQTSLIRVHHCLCTANGWCARQGINCGYAREDNEMLFNFLSNAQHGTWDLLCFAISPAWASGSQFPLAVTSPQLRIDLIPDHPFFQLSPPAGRWRAAAPSPLCCAAAPRWASVQPAASTSALSPGS